MKYTKKEYESQIATATPARLIVITFDILLDGLALALANSSDSFYAGIGQALESIEVLINSLDMEIAVSTELFGVYVHIVDLLNHALVNENRQLVKEAETIIKEISEAFIQAESQTSQQENKVYKGLTYDKQGNLTEFSGLGTRNYKA